MTFRVSLLASILLTGCREPAPEPAAGPVPAPAAETWTSQLAAVRDGRSDEIRTSDLVTSHDFRELALVGDRLTVLVLDRADLRDEDLNVLSSAPRLRWLKLPVSVGDSAAAAIFRCGSLEILNLPAANLTDRGLAELAGLERLTLLRLGSPNVTDDGLKALAGLPNLRFLHLIDVPITDAGLEHVAAMASLESFYLDGGRATETGLRGLLERRPDLHFHKDQRHLPGDPNADVHD